MPETDEMKRDPAARNDFIEKHQNYILKVSSHICKRHISTSDDEFSIALSAFNEAIDRFHGTGSFLHFAALVIRSRLLDYFRAQNRSGYELIDENDTAQQNSLDRASVSRFILQAENELRALEIEQLTGELKSWDITLRDLSKTSPKHKSKKAYINSIILLFEKDHDLLEALRSKQQLPLELLETNYQIRRKKIEPYRKYIIAGILMRTGNYDYLKSYITEK